MRPLYDLPYYHYYEKIYNAVKMFVTQRYQRRHHSFGNVFLKCELKDGFIFIYYYFLVAKKKDHFWKSTH